MHAVLMTTCDRMRFTITEAARLLGLTPAELLDFDQTLGGDWDHQFTQAEVDELAHVLAHLDESGAYREDGR